MVVEGDGLVGERDLLEVDGLQGGRRVDVGPVADAVGVEVVPLHAEDGVGLDRDGNDVALGVEAAAAVLNA